MQNIIFDLVVFRFYHLVFVVLILSILLNLHKLNHLKKLDIIYNVFFNYCNLKLHK